MFPLPMESDAAGRAMRLSDGEREQAVEPLKEAYAAGRLDDAEFQHRLDAVWSAQTRGELVPLLGDLPVGARLGAAAAPKPVPGTFRPAGAGSAGRAAARVTAGERSWAVAAHALGLCTSFVGPVLVARGGPGRRSEFVRRQATEAANFQFTALMALIGLGVLTGATFGLVALLFAPLTMAWFVLSCVGAARSVDGLGWRYPLALRPMKP